MKQQDESDSRGYYRRLQSAIEELLILKGVFTGADVEREVKAMDSRDPGRGVAGWTRGRHPACRLNDGG
jgi:hypothetical protein